MGHRNTPLPNKALKGDLVGHHNFFSVHPPLLPHEAHKHIFTLPMHLKGILSKEASLALLIKGSLFFLLFFSILKRKIHSICPVDLWSKLLQINVGYLPKQQLRLSSVVLSTQQAVPDTTNKAGTHGRMS